MDLKALTYFVTVAEELNITRAAEKLNMSQPPLSSQMKNLEEELNTTLFIRGKRHITLTESGKLLYRRAKEIIGLSNKAADEIISMSKGTTGTISVGLIEGMAPKLVADCIMGFRKQYPLVKFEIIDGNTDDALERLRSGLVNLAIITAPCDDSLLHSIPIYTSKVLVMMNKNHPLAKKSGTSISIKDLVDEPIILPRRRVFVDNAYRAFKKLNKEPDVICQMDSYLDAVALSAKGAGITIYPATDYIPTDEIVTKELTDSDEIQYLFVWKKGHPLPTIEEAFIDYVKENLAIKSK